MNRKKMQVMSIPYVLWVIGFTVIPLIFVIAKALPGDNGITFSNLFAIFDSVHKKALVLSLELAFICSLICILISYPAALILKSSRLGSKKIMIFIMILA